MDTSLPATAAVPDAIRSMLKSQYHAALAMHREAVERCPDELWYDTRPRNAYWQVAYHALFFTHLYLQKTAGDFRPWAGHQSDVQHEDGLSGPPDPTSALRLIPRPYTRDEVLEYAAFCDSIVGAAVDSMDLLSETSGFHWYPIPKLEHQIVNIRHLEHHTAQLIDRLRAALDVGVRWVGARRPPPTPEATVAAG